MQGELNFFVDSFLEILNNGQNILMNNLQTKIVLREEALRKIESDSKIKKVQGLTEIMEMAVETYAMHPEFRLFRTIIRLC